MIPRRALFTNLTNSPTWNSQFSVKNVKFLHTCSLQENSSPFIIKRNIKIIRSLKLKSFDVNYKSNLRTSHIVNCLCKKNLSTTKLKISHKAIPLNPTSKLRFSGFKMMKKLKTLNLDFILYPKRSKNATNWSEMFQYLLNYSNKLQTFSLAFRNSYCIQGELKRTFSRIIRQKALENFQLTIANPPVSGNNVLKGGICLLQKMPILKSFRLKGGYSGLKVCSETYLHFLKALYKIQSISYVNLDFDISFIKRSLKPELQEGLKLPSIGIKNLVLNVNIRDRILKYLKDVLSSVPELKTLDLKLNKKDHCESDKVYLDWVKIIEIISNKKDLEELSMESQSERKSNHDKGHGISRILGWVQDKYEGICLKRNRRTKVILQNEYLTEKFLEIPQRSRNLKKFSFKFPSEKCLFFTDFRSSK